MDNQPLLIGTSDFDEIIEENALVVDKSLFIKEFMDDPCKVSAILRPRRFGKSLNLSMLKSFLSIGAVSTNFNRFLISNETEFVVKHCGQYPVVFLDLKDCKGNTWQEMYGAIWRRIRTMVLRHFDEISLEIEELKSYGVDFKNPTAYGDEGIVSDSLAWLMSCLNKKHRKRVIVLVDEYDAPLNHAFRQGYYEQASSFFGSFYSQALKGNSALKKACLMGIVEVRDAGIFRVRVKTDILFLVELNSFTAKISYSRFLSLTKIETDLGFLV